MTKRIPNYLQWKPAKKKSTSSCQVTKTNKQTPYPHKRYGYPQSQKPLRLNLFSKNLHSAVPKTAGFAHVSILPQNAAAYAQSMFVQIHAADNAGSELNPRASPLYLLKKP